MRTLCLTTTPWPGYTLVQPVVRGIQGQGVIANVKHCESATATRVRSDCRRQR